MTGIKFHYSIYATGEVRDKDGHLKFTDEAQATFLVTDQQLAEFLAEQFPSGPEGVSPGVVDQTIARHLPSWLKERSIS